MPAPDHVAVHVKDAADDGKAQYDSLVDIAVRIVAAGSHIMP